MDTFCSPYIDDRVGDHTSIAAGRRGTERDGVIDKELTLASLKDEPGFMVRKGRACSVELGDVNSTCLSAWGGQCNLEGEGYELICSVLIWYGKRRHIRCVCGCRESESPPKKFSENLGGHILSVDPSG